MMLLYELNLKKNMWLKEYSKRILEINNFILSKMPGVFKLRRIPCEGYLYVLTLKKLKSESFLSRVELFHEILSSILNSNENLVCNEEDFCIVSKAYKIIYNLICII